jgi:hypothetical protein
VIGQPRLEKRRQVLGIGGVEGEGDILVSPRVPPNESCTNAVMSTS